jgi:hypothetical protein
MIEICQGNVMYEIMYKSLKRANSKRKQSLKKMLPSNLAVWFETFNERTLSTKSFVKQWNRGLLSRKIQEKMDSQTEIAEINTYNAICVVVVALTL